MPTIYDVAKIAGVSAKTVSRVINGDAPVGLKTRDKVIRAIDEIGFVPSSAARMMRSSRSGLVGLITGAISNNMDQDSLHGLPDMAIIQGIQRVFTESSRTLMIADTGGNPEKIKELVRTFAGHRVEGLIYVADRHLAVDLPEPPEGCELLLVNCFDYKDTPCVLPDDEIGEHDLTVKLIEAGHKRIAYLTLPSEMPATRERSSGYCAALERAGIPFDPALIVEGAKMGEPMRDRFIRDAVSHLLMPDPPTVICTGNDEMAVHLYRALRSLGKTIPDDISVAGFDNYRAIAIMLDPQLTTVQLPYYEMGLRAGQWMLNRIRGEDHETEKEMRVGGPVIWRRSVAQIES